MIHEFREKKVGLYAKLPKAKKLAFIGKVSEPDYKLIRNRIIGHCEGGTKELVTLLLQKAGWDVERDQRNIFVPVIETFMQAHGLNLNALRKFVNSKEQCLHFSHYLEARKPFNIYEMLGHVQLLPPAELKKLVDQLWTITTCVKQVGVGPGEICLTTLTSARKGARGDLIITDVGDIEVKSTYGRLGSGDNALQVPERFAMLLESRNYNIHAARARIAHDTGKEQKPNSTNWTWNEAIQCLFYYNWGFTESTITRAFAYLSPQRLDFSQHSSLMKGIRRVWNAHPVYENLLSRDRKELTRMVLAVQLATYQAEHKFPYLLCANKESKNACPLYFDRKNVEENFISVYNQLLTINRFTSNLAIDSEGTRKGVEINYR